MWLFTTLGFFSCTRSKDEPDKIQMRARERGDLENLVEVFGISSEIIETRGADYRWRLIVTETTFQNTVRELAKRVDYSNFKDEVHSTPGQERKASPYLRVWSAMAGLQDGSAGRAPAVAGGTFKFDAGEHLDWVTVGDIVERHGEALKGRVLMTKPDASYPGGLVRVLGFGQGPEKDDIALVVMHPSWERTEFYSDEPAALMPEGTPDPCPPKVNVKDALKNPNAKDSK